MKQLYLIRNEIFPSCIRGRLIVGDQVLSVLERLWLNNARNKSCIPADTNSGAFLARSGSGKYKKVFHLRDVKGRSGILMHNGNVVSHSKGCLIIGLKPGRLANQPAVLNSRSAMQVLRDYLGTEPFQIQIFGNQIWNP